MAEFLCIISFSFFSILIAGADIKTGAVPRAAFVFAFPFFFTLKILPAGLTPIWLTIAGLLVGLMFFLLVFFISKKKLGLADVWYSALTGMILGPFWWYAAIGSACFTGIVYMVISKRRIIPFIPFMAAGSIAAVMVQFFR